MKMTCPSCGAIHSAEAWANDADARMCLAALVRMPKAVETVALQYLGFFRPASGRGLQWKKALRLLNELHTLATAPEIAWKHNRRLQNKPQYWAAAIERMIARPPSDLPLDKHNYLRAIAYGIAKDESIQVETKRNEDEATGVAQATRDDGGYGEGLSKDNAKGILEAFKARLKADEEKAGMHSHAQHGNETEEGAASSAATDDHPTPTLPASGEGEGRNAEQEGS